MVTAIALIVIGGILVFAAVKSETIALDDVTRENAKTFGIGGIMLIFLGVFGVIAEILLYL